MTVTKQSIQYAILMQITHFKLLLWLYHLPLLYSDFTGGKFPVSSTWLPFITLLNHGFMWNNWNLEVPAENGCIFHQSLLNLLYWWFLLCPLLTSQVNSIASWILWIVNKSSQSVNKHIIHTPNIHFDNSDTNFSWLVILIQGILSKE